MQDVLYNIFWLFVYASIIFAICNHCKGKHYLGDMGILSAIVWLLMITVVVYA